MVVIVVTSVEGRRQLRSATTWTLLLPRVRTSAGQRSFAVFGPATWNRLTVYLLRYEPPNCRWAPSSACWRLSFSSMREPSSGAVVHDWTASSAPHTNIRTQLNSTQQTEFNLSGGAAQHAAWFLNTVPSFRPQTAAKSSPVGAFSPNLATWTPVMRVVAHSKDVCRRPYENAPVHSFSDIHALFAIGHSGHPRCFESAKSISPANEIFSKRGMLRPTTFGRCRNTYGEVTQ